MGLLCLCFGEGGQGAGPDCPSNMRFPPCTVSGADSHLANYKQNRSDGLIGYCNRMITGIALPAPSTAVSCGSACTVEESSGE